MKTIFTTILFVAICKIAIYAQITFQGCAGVLGAQNYVLSQTGTTNDGGVRNTFEATPNDFAQSCPAGVCELRIIWNITLDRWEIQLDNDGPIGTPDYTTGIMYFNNAASFPNPPDLTLGTWQSAGFCPDGVSTLNGDVQPTVTMPIELLYFEGKEGPHYTNVLKWQTASETNNQHFVIEQAFDGIDFKEIGRVEGAGTSTSRNSYEFIHDAPAMGNNYYRLVQVDFDGSIAESKTIVISTEKELTNIQIFPSPARNSISLLTKKDLPSCQYRVLSITGQVLLMNTIEAGDSRCEIDVSTLQSGIYSLQLLLPSGKEVFSFVKK